MGGGLMQLVAYGAQDIYLTGNPQITFFKVVYRRHTNFSMELIEQTLNGSVGASDRVTATISRNGDLIHDMYYKIKEGAKERLQYYEGVIISIKNSGLSKTITVRRVLQNIGVERVFLINSPKIKAIEIKRSSKVRRAKLYYLRNLSGKATRLKQKFK